VWVGSVGSVCVGWECGFVCESGGVLTSFFSSSFFRSIFSLLIAMYAFVVAVIETPVPLKNARNQVQIRVT
jgi:hypothetical protein